MSRSDWDDDEQYEVAPLPAHERGWRHPSEIGQQAWMHSEPPLAIGRGLTMATGTIGCVLALAVLWTMVPTQAGRSANSSVRATSAVRGDSSAASFGTQSDLAGTIDTPLTSTSDSFISASTTSASNSPSASVSVAPLPPMPTYQVQQGTAESQVAIAVAVNGGSLVVTTAQAVSTDATVNLMLPDGSIAEAQVLFVDDRSGLAVLAPQTANGTMAFAVASGIASGDQLTYLGDSERTTTVADDLVVTAGWFDDSVAIEGAPVVNQRGELVALCSRSADGTRLVRLDNLDQLQQAIRAFTGAAPVWLGVVLNDDPSGKLSIGAIDPAGPAVEAGLTSGDVIVSIDGIQLTSVSALAAALAQHAPGDVVEFVVERPDGSDVTVAVTLAAPKTAV